MSVKYLTLLALFSLTAAFGQTQLNLSQSGGPTAVYPGATVTLNLNLTGSTGQNISGLQWTHNLLTGSVVTVAPGAASISATKGSYCNTSITTCLLTGFTGTPPTTIISNNVFADGVVETIVMPVPITAIAGVQQLSLVSVIAVSSSGSSVVITSPSPLSFTVLSLCDLNGDKTTDANDVLIAINQSTGKTPCTNDLNGDGVCTVIDVERVVVASNGGSCKTGT